MTDIILGSYENAKRMYEQKNGKNYFEFEFSFVDQSQNFREINRFLWESKHEMTRFKNRYSGPVLIDLSQWNDEQPNIYFDAFMYFLKDSEDIEVTFAVDNDLSHQLKKRIEKLFELEIITLDREVEKEEARIGF